MVLLALKIKMENSTKSNKAVLLTIHSPVAQLVEHAAVNRSVPGSIPGGGVFI